MRKFYGSDGYIGNRPIQGILAPRKFCSECPRFKLTKIIFQLHIHGLNTAHPYTHTHTHTHTLPHTGASPLFTLMEGVMRLLTFRKPSFWQTDLRVS